MNKGITEERGSSVIYFTDSKFVLIIGHKGKGFFSSLSKILIFLFLARLVITPPGMPS